nr:hypothetical protein KPHV_62310 [Kitasatospora purpeofusca]
MARKPKVFDRDQPDVHPSALTDWPKTTVSGQTEGAAPAIRYRPDHPSGPLRDKPRQEVSDQNSIRTFSAERSVIAR